MTCDSHDGGDKPFDSFHLQLLDNDTLHFYWLINIPSFLHSAICDSRKTDSLPNKETFD